MKEQRKVMRLDENNYKWEEIDFCDLRDGDTFQLYDRDGSLVKDEYGQYKFLATSDPYLNEEKTWTINIT